MQIINKRSIVKC